MVLGNGSKKFLQTGPVLNTSIFWALSAEITGRMIKKGLTPQFRMGDYFKGSDEYNSGLSNS